MKIERNKVGQIVRIRLREKKESIERQRNEKGKGREKVTEQRTEKCIGKQRKVGETEKGTERKEGREQIKVGKIERYGNRDGKNA